MITHKGKRKICMHIYVHHKYKNFEESMPSRFQVSRTPQLEKEMQESKK